MHVVQSGQDGKQESAMQMQMRLRARACVRAHAGGLAGIVCCKLTFDVTLGAESTGDGSRRRGTCAQMRARMELPRSPLLTCQTHRLQYTKWNITHRRSMGGQQGMSQFRGKTCTAVRVHTQTSIHTRCTDDARKYTQGVTHTHRVLSVRTRKQSAVLRLSPCVPAPPPTHWL